MSICVQYKKASIRHEKVVPSVSHQNHNCHYNVLAYTHELVKYFQSGADQTPQEFSPDGAYHSGEDIQYRYHVILREVSQYVRQW